MPGGSSLPGMPALLLDLYNTLVSGGDDDRDAMMAATARDVGVDPAVYRDLFHATWADRLTGRLGSVEDTVGTLALRAGAHPTTSAVRLAAARRRSFTRKQLWPSSDTLAALASLRAAGWRLAVVTNCTIETAELWPTTPLSTHVDAVVFSSILGVGKPDPAIYLAACSLLGVAPTDCVYCGDGADNELQTAAALGMSAIRTVEFVPSSSSWPPTRVASLGELAAALTVHAPLTGPAPLAGSAPSPAAAPVSPPVAPWQSRPADPTPVDPFAPAEH
jgi:putative hydrolase of the HAD superfamily